MSNRVLFIGSKDLGFALLRELVNLHSGDVLAVTMDDRNDTRTRFETIQTFCTEHDVQLTIAQGISELQQAVSVFRPSVAFVANWYQLIPGDVLRSVKHGIVGFHASLLPQLRGFAPMVWAILLGLRETGVSLFYLEEGMDTGDIIGQTRIPIRENDTVCDLLPRVSEASLALLRAHGRSIIDGTAHRTTQDDRMATYAAIRLPSDGRIDWRRSSKEIVRFIRAQTKPYPGAFTQLSDERTLRIWQASVFPHDYYGAPGQICHQHENDVVVTCGEGAVVLRHCEVDGVGDVMAQGVLRWNERLH